MVATLAVSEREWIAAAMVGLDPADPIDRIRELLTRPAWHADSACRGRAGFYELDVATARAVCLDCPVRVQCATFALEGNETGVWGGTTDLQRQRARDEAWTLDELLASEPDPSETECSVCGEACDRVDARRRCAQCVVRAKRQARKRAEAFAADRARTRERGLKLRPAWRVR